MTYVHFEIMFLVEFAELISDGTVSGSGLDTLLEGVLFREGLVRKVRVLLKVLSSRVNSAIYIYILYISRNWDGRTYEYKLIRSKVVYILLELNVLQERKGMLVKLGSDVGGHKLVRKLSRKYDDKHRHGYRYRFKDLPKQSTRIDRHP